MKRPLSKSDAVYATCIAANGTPYIERGFVTRLHDDYIEMLCFDSKAIMTVKREHVVSAEKMRQLNDK